MKQDDNKSGKAAVGYTRPGEGQDGVDKAPGEETSSSTDDTVRQAQKGKQQVDADLENPSDRAAE